MKVRFIHGFQGRETNELYYEAGQVVEFDSDLAQLLIRDGRAMLVEEPAVLVEDEPVVAPPKRVIVKRTTKKVKQ